MPELARPEPSRLYRWAVLLFVSLAMGGNYYIYDSINPLERIFIDKLGYSATGFGSVASMSGLNNGSELIPTYRVISISGGASRANARSNALL